jgi:hypothetical protein
MGFLEESIVKSFLHFDQSIYIPQCDVFSMNELVNSF